MPSLLGHLSVHDYLQEDITQLLLHMIEVEAVDRLQ